MKRHVSEIYEYYVHGNHVDETMLMKTMLVKIMLVKIMLVNIMFDEIHMDEKLVKQSDEKLQSRTQ